MAPTSKAKQATGKDGRPARTAAAPVARSGNPVSRIIAEVQAVPGGKGVFFAFLFSIVAAIMILFVRVARQEVLIVPAKLVETVRKANNIPNPSGFDPKKAIFTTDYALALYGPVAIAIALIPVLITGTVFAVARRENRRRNFMIGAAAMFLFVLQTGSLGAYFIFAFGGLVYATYKVRQAEPPPPRPTRVSNRRRRDDSEVEEPDDKDESYDDD